MLSLCRLCALGTQSGHQADRFSVSSMHPNMQLHNGLAIREGMQRHQVDPQQVSLSYSKTNAAAMNKSTSLCMFL